MYHCASWQDDMIHKLVSMREMGVQVGCSRTVFILKIGRSSWRLFYCVITNGDLAHIYQHMAFLSLKCTLSAVLQVMHIEHVWSTLGRSHHVSLSMARLWFLVLRRVISCLDWQSGHTRISSVFVSPFFFTKGAHKWRSLMSTNCIIFG